MFEQWICLSLCRHCAATSLSGGHNAPCEKTHSLRANGLPFVLTAPPSIVSGLQLRKEGRKIYSSLAASKADRME